MGAGSSKQKSIGVAIKSRLAGARD